MKSNPKPTSAGKTQATFSKEERQAMRERVRELNEPNDERAVLAKLAALPQPDRALGERLHALIRAVAPELSPKTWYGMPAYARDANVVCFFQPASRFKARYSTLGFSDKAKLDDGRMWATGFALTELTPAEEAKIVALLKKAMA